MDARTIISLVLAAALGADGALASNAAGVDIGDSLQLPWDDYIVDEEKTDIPVVQHSPAFRETVFVCDAPWEGDGCADGTIIKDGNIYRLYYIAWQMRTSPDSKWRHKQIFVCYAESKDGRRWTRPNLGLYEFNGSKANNILFEADDYGVFLDTNPNCPPDQRYKLIRTYAEKPGTSYMDTPLYVFLSADGVHFRPGWKIADRVPASANQREPGVELIYDTRHSCHWDPRRKEYRLYTRGRHPKDPEHRKYVFGSPPKEVRDIRVLASKDFKNWSYPEELSYGPDAEDSEMYTPVLEPYFRAPDVFVALPARYTGRNNWKDSHERLPDRGARIRRVWRDGHYEYRFATALTDGMFMFSRDGRNFHRREEAFFRPGPERTGTWVYGSGYAFNGFVVTPGPAGAPDELSIYYETGKWLGDAARFERYAIRMDGFLSRQATYAGGTLVTKPLVFKGDDLHINFSTAARGSVVVKVKDVATGRVISSEETFGDSTDRVVAFPGGTLEEFAGRPVVLEFTMRDADLYSFRFAVAPKRPPVFLRGKIDNCGRHASLNRLFPKAFAFLKRPDISTLAPGRYQIAGADCWAEIEDYPTRGYMSQNSELEVHRRFIEIYAPISCNEGIGRLDLVRGEAERLDYDAKEDRAVFHGPVQVERLVPGDYAIFFPPYGAHMPGINLDTNVVRHVVVRVKVK